MSFLWGGRELRYPAERSSHLPEARSQKLSSPLALYLSFKNNFDMETPAFIYAIFLWFLLISVTGYSIYVGFGPPSKELKDPFEDHED